MLRTITENMLYNIKNNCSKICIYQKKVVPLQRERKRNKNIVVYIISVSNWYCGS